VTVLVDDPIWPWRGRRWAHLVSDSELDELHAVAHSIGMPYLSFQGDHYDVHEGLRLLAIDRGALPTPARDLVRALRAAGLRHKGSMEPWKWSGSVVTGPHAVVEALDAMGLDDVDGRERCVAALSELGEGARLRTARRSATRLAVVSADGPRRPGGGLERISSQLTLHRSAGERGAFVEVALEAAGL
jgi:hypothetical protein